MKVLHQLLVEMVPVLDVHLYLAIPFFFHDYIVKVLALQNLSVNLKDCLSLILG